ncbi:hypothetical protein [Sulfoacidibacillus thermotolerans]|uniref:Uncharacterized protein n=1 Tax=Sulfoacidibacillus thermotolerans TaxID=1765684 RepID=A0A2U3DCC7_SULT2|nr:hypothetical protein [Sulfoacidibacillus thermotolerans]PWI58939.1 hypothetical protein BM613_02370 [Sulfoacidibacillus thermotolerans]
MMIPRHHWHHYIGQPVLVHTTMGTFHGYLHGITDTHVHLHGVQVANAIKCESPSIAPLNELPVSQAELVFYPAAMVALPIAAIIGITALGLGAMSGW